MKTIMVQMSDQQWTMKAIHLGSALAHNNDASIVLLHLVLASNPGLVDWGVPETNAQEEKQIQDYAAVAKDYDVAFRVQQMEYISLPDALIQAVRRLNASIIFAHIPSSHIPFWQQFQEWNVRRQLGDCRLYTLDEESPIQVEEAISSPERVNQS